MLFCQAGKCKQRNDDVIKSICWTGHENQVVYESCKASYLLRFNEHEDVFICKVLSIYVGTSQLLCLND